MTDLLLLRGLSVFYGDMQALWDVSLDVPEGMIVALIGANGAGKTTVLRTVSGLLQPRRGSIVFAGEPIHGASPAKIVEGGLVHVSEARNLFPRMPVYENLELGAYSRRGRGRVEEGLEQVFEIFPVLWDRRKQLAGTMSGGEQQMLAIARGLMSQPKMVMFDEPSLGLAPLLVQELFRVIAEINRRGVTVLLVEQNVRHALEIAHRCYVLETGRIVLTGTGEEMLRNDHVRSAYMGL